MTVLARFILAADEYEYARWFVVLPVTFGLRSVIGVNSDVRGRVTVRCGGRTGAHSASGPGLSKRIIAARIAVLVAVG